VVAAAGAADASSQLPMSAHLPGTIASGVWLLLSLVSVAGLATLQLPKTKQDLSRKPKLN